MTTFLLWDHSPFLYISDLVSIRYYSIFFAIGLLFIFYRIVKELVGDLNKDYLDKTLIGLVFYMLVGSRIFHCLFYEYNYYSHNLLEVLIPVRFSPLEFTGYQGLSSHGGFIGALIYLVIIFKRNVNSYIFFKFIDSLLLNSLVFISLIRIGNFYNSEIIGKQCSIFFCVVFPYSGYEIIPRHPVQIYEAIVYLFIFLLVTLFKYKKSFKPGEVSLCVVTFASFARFILEFYKEAQSDIIFSNINMGQVLSTISFLTFLLMYLYFSKDLNNEKGKIIN